MYIMYMILSGFVYLCSFSCLTGMYLPTIIACYFFQIKLTIIATKTRSEKFYKLFASYTRNRWIFFNFKSIRHHYDSYLQFFFNLSRKREQIKRNAFNNPPRVNNNKDPTYLQPPFPRMSNYTCINPYNKVHLLPHYKRIQTFDLLVCKPILQ